MNIFDKTTDRERFREVMGSLNFWQKIEYLFQYYWWTLLILFLVFCLGMGINRMVENANTKVLYCGTMANVSLNTDGWEYVTNDYKTLLGYTEKDNCISDAFPTMVDDPANKSFFLFSYAANISASGILDMVRNEDLDYLIGDEYSTHYYLSYGWYQPLDQVLNAQQLALLEDKILYVADEAGNTYPAAVEITDLAFIQDCVTNLGGPVYMMFPNTSPRADRTAHFVDYLLAYQPEK